MTNTDTTTVRRVHLLGRFVKFEHSIFSIPMFFAGAVIEGFGWPSLWNLWWMMVAGVGARTLAMALNRLIDRNIDAQNPRTSNRELPAGLLSVSSAWWVIAGGTTMYLGAAIILGGWCLKLAWVPPALFIVYPYMKRWTAFCHLGVGLSLGLSPLGGSLAAHPHMMPGLEPYMLATFTTLWVTGFDIIYATLDEAFDRETGLNSAVVNFGKKWSLFVAALSHVIAALILVILLFMRSAGPWQWSAALVVTGLLLIEHLKREQVDFAFFQVNSIVGFFVLAACL
jgi:4-hydroxybenzoate polyprenyltransferase